MSADTEAPASPDTSLRARILRHVDSAIRVGAVTPRETAERFGISVRKLHHLFAGEQRAFMQAVMDRRAQWCALAMSMTPDATPNNPRSALGLADSSHFAKAWDRLDRPRTRTCTVVDGRCALAHERGPEPIAD